MTLVKWTPRSRALAPFTSDSWANNLDSFIDSFLPGTFGSPLFHNSDWLPSFDVLENDKESVIRVEAPGMKKSEFNVTVKDGVLTLSGEKKGEEAKDDDRYMYRESRYGRFSRSFRLPEEALENKIKANYKNGVLAVSVPRSKPLEAKEIEVEIS